MMRGGGATTRARRGITAAAVIAACAGSAVAVSGCGASASGVIDPVARAAVVSNQAAGMRMNMTMQLTSSALPNPILMTGEGAFRIPDHTGSFVLAMHLPNLPQIVQALGSDTLQISELLDGTKVYIRLPQATLGRSAAARRPWLKIDLAQAASAAGVPGLSALVNNPTSSDPSQYLRYLRASGGAVTKVGTDTVNGVPSTHYRARINLARVPDAFPAAARDQVRQAVAALERIAHIQILPVNVWIDDHQLVRRMQISFQETVVGQSFGVAMRLGIPQYGPQPALVLPPASQVTDITHYASGASRPGPFGTAP